ncbi:hypothetical protein ACFLQ7_02780 [Actinomycetota bacterium]
MWFASLVLHALAVIPIRAPTILEDEYVVIGLSRMLAIGGPEPLLNKHYPGMSILLSPVQRFTEDPYVVFTIGQAINVLLASLLVPLAYLLCRRLAPRAGASTT